MNGAIEGTAELLLRAAGAGASGTMAPDLLVERLLGGRVRVAPAHVLIRDGALARVGADWCIFLRADLPAPRRAFNILHEIGHWAIGREASEAQCDALAAALLAPRGAFLQALRLHGARLPKLASLFVTTESCIALRLGEATGEPLALVTPSRVHVRGGSYSWPTDLELRACAGGKVSPGLRRSRLRDDAGRAMLRAC